MRRADSCRGPSSSTASLKYLPLPLGVRPLSPQCPAHAPLVCPCPNTCTRILTRVPVPVLSVYEELRNLGLDLGSSGISSLFLNHWYWDLGKPSSSTQLSSANFPKGTDFGTLHFGTTGFTVVAQNIWHESGQYILSFYIPKASPRRNKLMPTNQPEALERPKTHGSLKWHH